MQDNVYGVSDRLKAFITFFSIALIIALIGLFIIPFISLPADSFALKMYHKCCSINFLYYFTPFVITAVIVFDAVFIVTVCSKKVIFTNDAIIAKNAFVTRKLRFDEIKGFAINRFVLKIETNSNAKKRISINLLSLNRPDNLVQNLENRFSSLDF